MSGDRACVSCRHYLRRPLLEPKCLHHQCVDAAFEHYDPVSGETRKWDAEQMLCYKARWNACGAGGRLWEPKSGISPNDARHAIANVALSEALSGPSTSQYISGFQRLKRAIWPDKGS